MADFEIERPSVDVQAISPTYNVNPPQFTIEVHGSIQGQRGEKGDPGQDGRDGVDGTNGINGIDGQDGVSVTSIEQTTTSTESGGTNIITATLSNGDVSTFEIMNGEAGSSGMETLEPPIILQELEDGFYRVPANTDVYGVEETEYDIQFTTNCSSLLCITHEEVADGDDPSTTYDLVSYYLIEDNGTYTSPSNFNIVTDCNVKIRYGAVCDDTGDEWRAGEISLKDLLKNTDVVNNLTSTSTAKPLSAAQGKALKDLIDAIVIPTNTSDLNNDSGFITSETDPVFSASAAAGISSSDISNWNGKSNFSGSYNDLTDKPTLFSGNYTDLTNKPTIPDELSDLTDDTTHRLVTDTEKTTWSGKQDALVSGTNIKTINNNSLLGSGNITISGGGGSATDVQINGTSIVVSDVANILTETAYDSSTNKLATVADLPDVSDFIDKDVNNLTNYSLTTNIQTNKNLTKGVEYIVGTQGSATNAWTGTSTDTGCSSGALYTGKVIIYHLPVAGSSSAATLNLTLPDGTTTGAKNIYRQASSTVTTTFAADCDILMVYDGTQWKVNAYVDTTNSNSIGYQLRTDKGVYVNGASTSIYRYQLLVQTENGLEAFTSTSNSTKTTKTQLSPKYLPGGDIRYYSSTTEITTGSDITSSSLWMQYHLDLRYSFNITSTTFTAKKPVYMKMSVNADGTLSPVYSALSGGHPLTQTLPTTADNYVYLHLGTAYSAYQLQLEIIHPMYEYKNGKLREYISETGGGGSATDVQVNGTSITSGGVANLLTETAYNSSTNKIATMSDLPTVPTNISSFTNDSGYITSYTETDPVYSASAASGITSTDITNWNNKSTFSGSYNDLTDKPTIPTVNNATLTIQKNGTTVKTFTANASSNVTANITVPTQTSELTNNSGYITNSVNDLTNYTPTSSLATVATSGSYNDLTNKPTIPTVPTNVSAFTNDSGYITGITSSDIYNVLGYYPAAEPSIYTYGSIRDITSINNQTYISLMDDITNDRPIAISLGATEYVDVLGTNNGNTTSLWYMTSDNTYEKITLTVSGTSVTVTTTTIEIPTKTSDLTNDSNFAVTNADNKFSVGQTIAGETVVDSIRTKNMFDSSYINNQWVSFSGSIVDAANANARRISCSSGDTFTLSATFSSSDSNNIIAMAFYNASGTLLNRYVATNSTTLTLTETAPNNTSYMYVGHYSNLPTTIQLETGSTATTYTPYQNLTPDTSGLDNGHFEESYGYGGFVKRTVRGNKTTYTFSVPNHQNNGFIRSALVMCGDKGFMAIRWAGNNGINPTVAWSSFTSSQVSLSHNSGILTITFTSTVYGSVDVLFTN